MVKNIRNELKKGEKRKSGS